MAEVAGNAACLVDPLDVSSIRSGVLKVIEDDDYREKLISAGRENVKRFEAKNIAEQYLDLYKEVYTRNLRPFKTLRFAASEKAEPNY